MLRLNGEPFTTGRSRFSDGAEAAEEGTAKIFIKIVPGELPAPILAQLDTGSPWCVFDPEIAGELGVVGDSQVPARLDTRFGRKDGHLVKVPIMLLADEGESLSLEATVFICGDWPAGRNFIGYCGLIQWIRVALDPQENLFYFGKVPEQ